MSPGEEPKPKQRLGRIIIDGKTYAKIEDVPDEFRERVRARLADLDEKPLRRPSGGPAAANSAAAPSRGARLALIVGLAGAAAAALYFL